MTKLGTQPSNRYYLSWVTQRMANRAPEYSHARKSPASIFKQITNPIAQEIQKTTNELIEERDNIHISVANIELLDHLYKVDLSPSIAFSYTSNDDDTRTYVAPTVHATVNNIEYEITQATNNDIESLYYTAIPSRVEDGEVSYIYENIIPTTQVSDLASISPNQFTIEGHVYVTISGNTTWYQEWSTKIYYSKCFIRGRTRKGVNLTEVIPLKYNGTFKSVNQWKQIDEFFVSYVDSTANISVDIFPWYSDGIIDKRNLAIDINGEEKWRWLSLNTHSWGQTLISEAYTTADFDLIRKGIDDKDIEQEIELLDSNSNNITFDAFVTKPYTDYIYAVSGSKLYVYNILMPYPDVKRLINESPDPKMDLLADKWVFARDEEATIQTRLLSFQDIPLRVRWSIETPSLQEYYMSLDGTFHSTTEDLWIENEMWDQRLWLDQTINFVLSERGTYIVSLECEYVDDDTQEFYTYTTKYLFYVPSITPETTLDIPVTVPSIEDLSFDSDGRLWALSGGAIYLLNIFYDYFIADYSRNHLWLREQYQSVRIDV